MKIYGNHIPLESRIGGDRRVVSLVPSMTQTLYDLGLAESLVGISSYCPRRDDGVQTPQVVGGVRDPDIQAIQDLRPDLIIANQEENDREIVETLAEFEFGIWVTFPKSVEDAIEVLWSISRLFEIQANTSQQILNLEKSISWLRQASSTLSRDRIFCPIWQTEDDSLGWWWMTANHDTYMSSVLELCLGANVFANRDRRYPLSADVGSEAVEDTADRDTRYPRLGRDEILNADPDMILVPSEPFDFDESQIAVLAEQLQDARAVQQGNIVPVDGRLLTWHGTLLAEAIAFLPTMRNGL